MKAMNTTETPTVIFLRRVAASYVRGDRRANAASVIINGCIIGGSLW